MTRIALLLATNIAVMLMLSLVCSLLGLDRLLAQEGMNLPGLLIVASIFGFGGAFISLLLSKTIAKFSVHARVIAKPANEEEAWLLQTVSRLANKAGIGMPEVAIYEGAPNAFATGARRDASLVAVSTGLMRLMNRREVEAVLGHEIAHVANGDMVTLTLIQGIMNTFVFFLARVIGGIVDRVVLRNERGRGVGYMITVFVCQIVLGILASVVVAYFSRRREYRADAGSAQYLGQPSSMMDALSKLAGANTAPLPDSMQALGISGGKLSFLLSTHPPIEDRIKALKEWRAH